MFIIKSSKVGGSFKTTKTLLTAQEWVMKQDAPNTYSIWKFVGSNANNPNHYTCVKTIG